MWILFLKKKKKLRIWNFKAYFQYVKNFIDCSSGYLHIQIPYQYIPYKFCSLKLVTM